MSRVKRVMPSPATTVAIFALVAALGGTAVAGTDATTSFSKKKTKQLINKQLNKKQGTLNVNSAKTADSAATADRASTADTATTADKAATADSATTAGSATTAADADQLGGLAPGTFVQTARSDIPGQTPGGPNGSTVRQFDFRAGGANQRLWYLGTLRWTFQCNATDLTSIRVFNNDPVEARIWIRWSEAGSTNSNVETVAVPDSGGSTAVMAGLTDDAVADFSYANANGMQVTGRFHATDSTGSVLSGQTCMVGGTATVTP